MTLLMDFCLYYLNIEKMTSKPASLARIKMEIDTEKDIRTSR